MPRFNASDVSKEMSTKNAFDAFMALMNTDYATVRNQYASDDSMYKDLKLLMRKGNEGNDNHIEVENENSLLFKAVASAFAENRDPKQVLQFIEDEDPKKKGEEFFYRIKAEYLGTLLTRDHESVLNTYRTQPERTNSEMSMSHSEDESSMSENVLNAPATHRLQGPNSILHEMIRLLNDGDRTGRGSSKEYKEIQNDLKELEKFMNGLGDKLPKCPEAKRFVKVMTESLIERAERYVDKRANRLLNQSTDSYQGKRVLNMRKVINRLQTISANFKQAGICSGDAQKNFQVTDAYKHLIDTKMKSSSVTKAVLSEALALRNAVEPLSMEELDENAKKNAESEGVMIVAEGFKGRYADPNTLFKCVNKANREVSTVRNMIKGAWQKNPQALFALKGKYDTLNQIDNYLHDPAGNLKNMIVSNPTNNSWRVTGDTTVDIVLFNSVHRAVTENVKSLKKQARIESEKKLENQIYGENSSQYLDEQEPSEGAEEEDFYEDLSNNNINKNQRNSENRRQSDAFKKEEAGDNSSRKNDAGYSFIA